MINYQKYINALRKCAKEHENDNTSTGHIIVSDLCHDTANLLESLEQDTSDTLISIQTVKDKMIKYGFNAPDMTVTEFVEDLFSVKSQEAKCNPASEKLSNVPADVLLDKIENDVNYLTSRYTVSRERGAMGQVEWSDRLIKESDVLNIINKYRESEDGKNE